MQPTFALPSLLPLLLLLPLVWNTEAQNETVPIFKVGMVRDDYLKNQFLDWEIFNGVEWWANWVNAQGGLVYNDVAHQVIVITKDAAEANPNKTVPSVRARATELVEQDGVHLMICPSSSSRTEASIRVTEAHKIINFATGALLQTLYSSTESYVFTSIPPDSAIASIPLQMVIGRGAKTFTMIRRPDVNAVALGDYALEFLENSGMVAINVLWVNVSSTDVADLQPALRAALTDMDAGERPDVFIYASIVAEFTTIAGVFEQVKPHVKAAIFLAPISSNVQEANSLGGVGDFWLTTTRFNPNDQFGVPGQLGGTTDEFVKGFTTHYKTPPVDFSAISASLLMSYYAAVNRSNSIDSDIVRAELKNMSTIQTFASPIKYFQNGTNMHYQIYPMQLRGGKGVIIEDSEFVYPAPFNPTSKLNYKIIIAIIVPIGTIVSVLVAFGVVYVRRQRKQVVRALVQVEEGERRNYKIDYSSLAIEHAIGSGGFGVVYKGEYRGAEVAVKKLKAQKLSKQQLVEFAGEASVMVGLRHPNILLFMGVCMDPPELCIITEYMSRGSLYDLLHNDKIELPFPLLKRMIVDALKGLQFIHSTGLIHRDLKSPNLLVDRSWNIKIADFGLSSFKSKSMSDTQISLLWTAPEILMQEADCYSEKSDVYSLGIIVWEMMSRKTPYEGMTAAAIPTAVIRGMRPTVDTKWNEAMMRFMSVCWDSRASNRPSVKAARNIMDAIYADPNFEMGSSSMLQRLVPPAGQVTFVNTIVYNSARLWEHDPRVMMRALLLLNDLVRETLQRHRGFEVKSNGESFLLAFAECSLAANFCLRLQAALITLDWPEKLLQSTIASEKKDASGKTTFKGITLSMGIHKADVTNEKNPYTGDVDYFGPECTVAAVLAHSAAPGTIALGADMYTFLLSNMDKVDAFSMQSLGTRMVNNGNTTHCYQMVPKALEERNKSSVTDDGVVMEILQDTRKFDFPVGPESWVVRHEDLEIGNRIGAGNFGEVKLGMWKGQKVAVKQLIKQKINETSLLEMRAESAMLSILFHPNIIKFMGMSLQTSNMCLVFEYMEKGSLSNILYNSNGPITWEQKRRLAIGTAHGLAYLHQKGIIHRDVKTSNVLVANDYTAKIADFGFSRMKADNQTMTLCGTVVYTAPEIFEGAHYTNKADIYSYGVVLWELLCRTKPWDGMHQMKVATAVTNGKRLPLNNLPPDTPSQIISLLQSCWNADPEQRPTAESISTELKMM